MGQPELVTLARQFRAMALSIGDGQYLTLRWGENKLQRSTVFTYDHRRDEVHIVVPRSRPDGTDALSDSILTIQGCVLEDTA